MINFFKCNFQGNKHHSFCGLEIRGVKIPGGGGGEGEWDGVLKIFLGGGVPPNFISDQNIRFSKPYFRPDSQNAYLFQTNDTLWGGTYLYGLYIGAPPSPSSGGGQNTVPRPERKKFGCWARTQSTHFDCWRTGCPSSTDGLSWTVCGDCQTVLACSFDEQHQREATLSILMYVEFRGDLSLRSEFAAVFLQWTRPGGWLSCLPW